METKPKSEYRIDNPATKHLPGAMYAAYLLASTSEAAIAFVYRVDMPTGDQYFFADLDGSLCNESGTSLRILQRLPRAAKGPKTFGRRVTFRAIKRIATIGT